MRETGPHGVDVAVEHVITMRLRSQEILENLVGVLGAFDQDLKGVVVLHALEKPINTVHIGTTIKRITVQRTGVMADLNTRIGGECPGLKKTGVLECLHHTQGRVGFIQGTGTTHHHLSVVSNEY